MSSQSPDIAHLYTDQHDAYAQYAPESFDWRFIETPAFNKHLLGLLSPNMSVLDVGCGTGRTPIYLQQNGVIPANIIGLDFNPDMIDVARRACPDARFIQADLQQLPLPYDSQNLIICTHVLHYLDNFQYFTAMKEFHRVLKPGGTLFTVITHPVRTVRKQLPTIQEA